MSEQQKVHCRSCNREEAYGEIFIEGLCEPCRRCTVCGKEQIPLADGKCKNCSRLEYSRVEIKRLSGATNANGYFLYIAAIIFFICTIIYAFSYYGSTKIIAEAASSYTPASYVADRVGTFARFGVGTFMSLILFAFGSLCCKRISKD